MFFKGINISASWAKVKWDLVNTQLIWSTYFMQGPELIAQDRFVRDNSTAYSSSLISNCPAWRGSRLKWKSLGYSVRPNFNASSTMCTCVTSENILSLLVRVLQRNRANRMHVKKERFSLRNWSTWLEVGKSKVCRAGSRLSAQLKGFLQWLKGKESSCSAGDTGDTCSISGSGRTLGEGNGNPL